MESVAIGLYLVTGLIAAPAFCFVLVRFVRAAPWLAVPLWYAGISIAWVFFVEVVLVMTFGSVTLRDLVGPFSVVVHVVVTFLAAPAVACSLLLGSKQITRWWPGVAAFCWGIGAFAIFHQYSVMESLYGVDGTGGPYS
jgi:hypothetical protein